MVTGIEQKGTNAVKKLRLERLGKGLPFMINSRELPAEQCYFEYPDGVIRLVKISTDKTDFVVLKEYSKKESSTIRNKFHLA